MVLTVRSQIHLMQTVSSEIQVAWALGEIPLSAANAADSSVLDKYLTGLVQIYPTVSYIHFGFTSGDWIGASYYSPNVLSVGARSTSTGNAWIDYATNQDGTRSSILKNYGYYNAVLRSWYILGAYKDKAGSSYNSGLYSDVYQWSGTSVLAVPWSMPLYALNPDGSLTTTLVGVVGCDATLTFISSSLASLVPPKGLSYITEADGPLVGTSVNAALDIDQRSAMLSSDSDVKASANALMATYDNFTAAQGYLEVCLRSVA